MALDLVDDPKLIAEYEEYHQDVWPEILESIHDSGIESMEIFRFGNRLFMIIWADNDFTFEKKGEMDSNNPKVIEWEELMWKYQQQIPGSMKGEKWVLMDRIFLTNRTGGDENN
nr:L-rhamnose mutarotase [Membranihabitans maritimus]